MRVTAGILILISILGIPYIVATMPIVGMYEYWWVAVLGILLVPLYWLIGGAICAFIRRSSWLALAGAITSIIIGFFMLAGYGVFGLIFILMGILALILLITSMVRGEFRR